jgi:hypothetical protein
MLRSGSDMLCLCADTKPNRPVHPLHKILVHPDFANGYLSSILSHQSSVNFSVPRVVETAVEKTADHA